MVEILLKREENAWGNREIAGYEDFLLTQNIFKSIRLYSVKLDSTDKTTFLHPAKNYS